ncbi:MAG: tetratricopeptide repeat protein [Candidatus Thorarchaeota archaeon]
MHISIYVMSVYELLYTSGHMLNTGLNQQRRGPYQRLSISYNMNQTNEFLATIDVTNRSYDDLLQLACEFVDRDDYTFARHLLTHIIKDKPDDALVHQLLGVTLKKLNITDEAEQVLKRALELEPDNRGVMYHLSSLLLQKRAFNDAERLITRAIELSDDGMTKGHYLFLRATILLASGKTGMNADFAESERQCGELLEPEEKELIDAIERCRHCKRGDCA